MLIHSLDFPPVFIFTLKAVDVILEQFSQAVIDCLENVCFELTFSFQSFQSLMYYVYKESV